MFEGLRRVKKDIVKEITDIGSAAKNLGATEARDLYMKDESKRAVRESRAWPTPEFAAEDSEMRDALMQKMKELSPEDLDGLEKAVKRVLAAQEPERLQILSDYENAPAQYLRLAMAFIHGGIFYTPLGGIAKAYLEHRQIQGEHKGEYDKAMFNLEERGKGVQAMIEDIRMHRGANDSQNSLSDAT